MTPVTPSKQMPRLMRWLAGAGFFILVIKIWGLMPPLLSPDEYLHLYRAVALSQGDWLLQPESPDHSKSFLSKGYQVGAGIDEGFIAYKDILRPLMVDPKRQLSQAESVHVSRLGWTGQLHFEAIPGAGYYMPLVYLPQSMSLALGRELGLGIHASYWLTRFLTTATCVLLLALAWRIQRPPLLAVAFLMLPMSIFQFLSPTIDGLTTSIAVVALSSFYAINSSTPPLSWKKSAAFGLSIFILASSRTHLLPLIVLPVWVWWKFRTRPHAINALLTILATLAWVGFALMTTVDARVQKAMGNDALVLHYLLHPADYLSMVWATLSDLQTLGFYAHSFVGILGWLNVLLPPWTYPCTGLLLTGIALTTAKLPATCNAHNWLLVLLALLSSFLVLLAMLVNWTPIGSALIQGVQGRYFIVPALMMAYGLRVDLVHRGTRSQILSALLFFCFLTLSVWALVSGLGARYD